MSALSESSLKRSDKAIIDIHQISSTLPSRNRKPVQQLDLLVDIAIGNNHIELATTSAHARNDDGRAASCTGSASYQTRVRDTVRVGEVVTIEVPGLAEALRRPGVAVEVDIVLTDGSPISTSVLIPDAASTLGLKAWARTNRQESRDAEDLWRCPEIALADGADHRILNADPTIGQIIPILERELSAQGPSLHTITAGLHEDERARHSTRIRALLATVAGVTGESR